MANPTEFGSFVPTTHIWDIGYFMELDVTSREFKELLVRLYHNVNLIATVLNSKDTGIYDTSIFVNGQQFFPNTAAPGTSAISSNFRPVYRKVINFGALPNNNITSIAHGITCSAYTTFTRIYGVATKPTVPYSYIPLPFVDSGGNHIELNVDNANVNIITTDDRSAYTQCYVIVEYLMY